MNMLPQYRQELRQLARARRNITRDYTAQKQSCERQLKHLRLSLQRGRRASTRELTRIDRRIAILEGRLSS